MRTRVMRVPTTKLRSRSLTTISRIMTTGQTACPEVRGASGVSTSCGVWVAVSVVSVLMP